MVLGCIIDALLVPMTTQACDFQEARTEPGFILKGGKA